MNWNPNDLHFEHIHLEISSKCALKCPRCPRTEHPETPWLSKQLGLQDIKRSLPEFLLRDHIQRITICGDVGDPIYNTEFHQILHYIKSVNPRIHLYVVTNGSYRTREWWAKTANILNEYDTVAFSIDGFDDASNQLYRIGSDWESIAIGMSEIQKSKAFMVWACILFSFNENKMDMIQSLARERGCDSIQITKSTKFGLNYARFKETQGIDPLQPSEKSISNSLRFERSWEHLSNRTIDNNKFIETMIIATKENEKIYAQAPVFPLCKNGNRGLYINVLGQLFPCSWVSFPYTQMVSIKSGRTIKFKDSFFNRYSDQFNLLKRDFKDVVSEPLWQRLFSGFQDEKTCFAECEQKCGQHVMTPEYKVGWFLN